MSRRNASPGETVVVVRYTLSRVKNPKPHQFVGFVYREFPVALIVGGKMGAVLHRSYTKEGTLVETPTLRISVAPMQHIESGAGCGKIP